MKNIRNTWLKNNLGHIWRRLRSRACRSGIPFCYNKHYTINLPGSMLDRERALKIVTYLETEHILHKENIHLARRISLARLRKVHPDHYLETLQEPGSLARLLGGVIPDGQGDEFLTAARAMVGGTVRAAKLALSRRGVAVNLGGGFHHAAIDQAEGYCVFNDIAVAVADCRADGFSDPVVVIDLDLHDGNGTRTIFARDDTVHTFSIHNRHLGSTEALASTSIALGDDVEDACYLSALKDHLPGLLKERQPGLIFYLAGADPALDDNRGTWRISPEGMLARDRFVMEQIAQMAVNIPVVVVLAGGYGTNAWRYSARYFAWLLAGEKILKTSLTLELPIIHYRQHLQGLSDLDLMTEPATEDWSLDESDLFPLGKPRQNRFLNYYSRYGLELALERTGLLDRLRKKGYRRLRVDWNLDDPAGQTIRILSVAEEPLILAELRVRRDRSSLAHLELLAVEWLLLQDPRAEFTPDRPSLPNQAHPGLGLLRDFAAVLILICERLGLDGLIFVPAHYSMAAQTKRLACFLDPEAEARFRSLQRTLKHLRLREAIKALDGSRVVHQKTGQIFLWQPSPLVLPVSERLVTRLRSEQYELDVQKAEQNYSFALLESPS